MGLFLPNNECTFIGKYTRGLFAYEVLIYQVEYVLPSSWVVNVRLMGKYLRGVHVLSDVSQQLVHSIKYLHRRCARDAKRRSIRRVHLWAISYKTLMY